MVLPLFGLFYTRPIFVASLALFLKRSLEYQLASKLPEISATNAFVAMKSIGIAELNLDCRQTSLAGQSKRLVSVGGCDARRIVAALGIKDIEPPGVQKTAAERSKIAGMAYASADLSARRKVDEATN